MTERHHASDGTLWNIYYDPPPVSPRHCDWTWVHDDYDGAPDAHDDRHGTAPTREAAIAAVEEWVKENEARFTLKEIRAACSACDNGHVPTPDGGSDECEYCGRLMRTLVEANTEVKS